METSLRPATLDDLAVLLALLDRVAAWLPSVKMEKQWPPSFSADPRWVANYKRWIGEGNVFVAEQDGHAIGTYRLTSADPFAWPEAEPGAALYLHTLAVDRVHAGTGLGRALLEHGCSVARARGVPELRLDCWSGNERLRRYYTEAGFEYRGDRDIYEELALFGRTGWYTVSLFARSLILPPTRDE